MNDVTSYAIRNARYKLRLAEQHLNSVKAEVVRAKKELREAELTPEAIMRMNRLGINPNVIDDFYTNGQVVLYSSDLDMFLSLGKEEKAIIRKLERDFDAMVYFVIGHTLWVGPDTGLVMSSFLYVNQNVVQLEHDSPIYGPNLVHAYTYNYDSPIDSEHSDIPVQRTPSGGLELIR